MVRDILTSLLLPTLTSELSTPSWFIQRKSYPPFCLRKLSGPAPSISIAPFISVYFATPFYHSTNQRWSSFQFSCFPPFQNTLKILTHLTGILLAFHTHSFDFILRDHFQILFSICQPLYVPFFLERRIFYFKVHSCMVSTFL